MAWCAECGAEIPEGSGSCVACDADRLVTRGDFVDVSKAGEVGEGGSSDEEAGVAVADAGKPGHEADDDDLGVDGPGPDSSDGGAWLSWEEATPRELRPSLSRKINRDSGPARIVSADAIAPVRKHLVNRNVVMAICAAVAVVAIAVLINVVGTLTRAYNIDVETFPDSGVRDSVFVADLDDDGKISRSEAATLTELTVEDASSISGLGIFPNLQTLTATGRSLTSVDLSDLPGLVTLDLSSSGITSLDLSSNTALKNLYIADVAISEIDLSTLEELVEIDVTDTDISSMDFSGNPSICSIVCDQSVEIAGLESAGLIETWVPVEYEAVMSSGSGSGRYSVDSTIVYTDTGAVNSISTDGEDGLVTSTYTYDDEGRMTMAVMGGDSYSESWSFVYDEAGRLVSASDDVNQRVLEYSYDVSGRLISCVETDADSGYEMADVWFAYDEAGRISRIKGDDSYVLAYDDAGRLASVSSEDGSLVYDYSYDSNGECISVTLTAGTTGAGFEETFTYSSEGVLEDASRGAQSNLWSRLRRLGVTAEGVESMTFERDSFGNFVSATAVLSDGTTDSCEVELVRYITLVDSAPVNLGFMSGNPLSYCLGEDLTMWAPWDVTELASDADELLNFTSTMVFDEMSEWEGVGNPLAQAAAAMGSALSDGDDEEAAS